MADVPVVQDDLVPIYDDLTIISDFVAQYQLNQNTDVVFDDPDFVDPTPDDPISKQDIIIYNQNKFFDSYEETAKKSIDMNQKFYDSVNDNFSVISSDTALINDNFTDLLGKMDTIIENQNTIIENQGTMQEVQNLSSGTILTYGLVYLPFAIVIYLLWRFFATFLRTFR